MTFACLMRSGCRLAIMVLCFAVVATAQTETATISGLITDDTGAVIPGTEVKLQSVDRGTVESATTNSAGIYVFASVHPGSYQLAVHKPGFKQIDFLGLVVNVQDHIEQNFRLRVGSAAESVTVEASAATINTTDATVSTVVDRQFAENLPLNGRSFQTLIYLTPGVVATPSTFTDGGQFSVNGQRTTSNYWMVDGVSANIGVGAGTLPGNGFGGTLGSFSAVGGTNSLVSVDAMQEFRIQTSTFSPEFGRTPGGQISIVTRSGTNQYHGTVFDYLRNDALDANNWFADASGLPKSEERQNDFGGTFSGPILRSGTFFFFSYEGLRLRLPQTAITTVPDATARQAALPALQPYLNAFPQPNGTDDPTNGVAQFNSSYSNPATLDAYSIRIDHQFGNKGTLFGRYNYSPSQIDERGGLSGSNALSMIQTLKITTQTATVGATWNISADMTNDLRLNYSRTNAQGSFSLDNFGGAVPLTVLPFPALFTLQNSQFGFAIFSLTNDNGFSVGKSVQNVLPQFNIVDSLSWQKGSHSLKFGIDYRRLAPTYGPLGYSQSTSFNTVVDSETGSNAIGFLASNKGATVLFRNLGLYAQDTWRLMSRLTLTYGLRWDVDVPPSVENGPSIPAVTGYSLTDFSNLAIAPPGTSPFKTTYGNVAPRIGVAYQVSQKQVWQTVIRGGSGVFYDLVSSETGNLLGNSFPPFGSFAFFSNATFPFSPAQAAPPPIPSVGTLSELYVFNPNLKLPYTIEWNFALEQALGREQFISATYVGAAGRRLVQTTAVFGPVPTNANLGSADFIDNTASSDYNALQIQFQRRLSHGLQGLAAYTWSHSIDNGSAADYSASNEGVPGSNQNRGNSSFDIRHALNAALTYDIPAPWANVFARQILHRWSVQALLLARSAPPVDLTDIHFFQFESGISANIRPDIVPGLPLYLYGPQYPGRKALNPAAFVDPPVNSATGFPLRQGDLPRNYLRGFGATQLDIGVHRDFAIHDSLMLQFRAEMFNVLNHPNFGPPNNSFGLGGFGVASQMLGQSLNGNNLGGGAFSPLYQIGGPRSIQLALKISF